MVLLASGGGYQYAGTSSPRRDGRAYPTEQVLAVLNGLLAPPGLQPLPALAGLHGASVVPSVSAGTYSRDLFVLLLFTGATPPPAGESALKQEVERLLAYELGRDALPDEIEVYPLYPRKAEGVIDHAWVRSQYLSGALHRKAKTRAFQLLTALRGQAARAGGGAPSA